MDMHQAPTAISLLINLSFPPLSSHGRSVAPELGDKNPVELRPRRVLVDVNGNIAAAEFALREDIAHQFLIYVPLNLFPAMFVSSGMDK